MTSKYAIRAVAYLAAANGDKKADSALISAATGIPRSFLQKILNTLKTHGYLSATRGIGGGFRLSKSPGSVNLFEIGSLFEDLDRFSVCPFGADGCLKAEKCPLHDDWSRTSAGFIEYLKTTTFAVFEDVDLANCFEQPEI